MKSKKGYNEDTLPILHIPMNIKDILKTKGIIKIDSNSSLATALMKLSSSHDAAFIFDKDEFIGVINPYYSLIKKSFPSNAKIKASLVHPPKVMIQTSLDKVMHMMNESKIHYLPVFDGKEFKGIVSARRLLRHIIDSDKLKMPIEAFLEQRKLHTLKDTDYLSKALTHFRTKKVSKLVVVDAKGMLAGVLAYYDVIKHLAEPRDRQNILSRKGEKNPLLKKPIRNFYKKDVLVLSKKHTLADAVHMILDKSIGSVLVTEGQKPLGIITTKDIFSAYLAKPYKQIAHFHGRGLSYTSRYIAQAFTRALDSLIRRSGGVKRADVTIIEKKKGALYEADVAISQKGKRAISLKMENRNLSHLLREAGRKLRRVIRKE